MAAAVTENKYYLKSLHEEIGLFDRKLAHLMKHGVYATDEERDAAAKKLTKKRETLAETARRLAAEGIEFKTSELPRSFLPEGTVVEAAPVEAEPEVAAVASASGQPNRTARRQASAYAGTSLDWEQSIRDYMSNKKA